ARLVAPVVSRHVRDLHLASVAEQSSSGSRGEASGSSAENAQRNHCRIFARPR
ncbi:unnamed protein product, partial [Symbiodinium pilosum]